MITGIKKRYLLLGGAICLCCVLMFYITGYSNKEENKSNTAYFGGSELMLLDGRSGSQIMSVIIKTPTGKLIVIDGGLKEDTEYLTKKLTEMGGVVDTWLVTHPHSDHVGALTAILNQKPTPIKINHVYYAVRESSWYHRYEADRAPMVDEFVLALNALPEEARHNGLTKGQKLQIDDIIINVMNDPFWCESNTINNSSVVLRFDISGRRVLFLGDLGWEGGEKLLRECTGEELKSDVVQVAHHGEDGVTRAVYEAAGADICLWPTPEWLWSNNENGKGENTGPWHTLETRKWMEELGVKMHVCTRDGDKILK